MATATIQQAFSTFQYASSGGQAKGDIVSTNDRVVVCLNAIAAGFTGPVVDDGVALFPKSTSGGSAISDGKKVYFDGTNVTESSSGNRFVGITTAASVDADATQPVRMFSSGNKVVTDSSGGSVGTIAAASVKQTLPIFVGTLVLVADTNTFSVAVPFAATVIAARFVTDKPVTTANKTTTLTLSTTGGAVTGGAMVLSSTATSNVSASGSSVAASAMTGANLTLTAGQRVIITASSTVAFVEGEGHVEVDVSNNDLANALATLAAK